MVLPQSSRRYVPSLLDRLLDDEPGSTASERPHDGQLLRELKASVTRDLQDMLNARLPLVEIPSDCPLLAESIANYGLPDLHSERVRETLDVGKLCETIKSCIERFEPRLRRVRVLPAPGGNAISPGDRRFRFSIDADLVAEPFQEKVKWSSRVEAESHEIIVEKLP
jgi:type VI secretion system protein ImpF